MARRFCVLTSGRAGSTALFAAILASRSGPTPQPQPDQPPPDLCLPSHVFEDCPDEELLHPKGWRQFNAALQEQLGRPIATVEQLIAGFFERAGPRTAGFKLMPIRRPLAPPTFFDRPDVLWITLERRDIAAAVASFMLARREGTWRRSGGAEPRRWTFGPDSRLEAIRRIDYLRATRQWLADQRQRWQTQGTTFVSIAYEDLVAPDFASPPLDAFFGGPVALRRPKPPTDPATYTGNFAELAALVEQRLAWLARRDSRRPNR